MLTRTSVHCADRIVEMSNWKGFLCSRAQVTFGYALSSFWRIARTRRGFAPCVLAVPVCSREFEVASPHEGLVVFRRGFFLIAMGMKIYHSGVRDKRRMAAAAFAVLADADV